MVGTFICRWWKWLANACFGGWALAIAVVLIINDNVPWRYSVNIFTLRSQVKDLLLQQQRSWHYILSPSTYKQCGFHLPQGNHDWTPTPHAPLSSYQRIYIRNYNNISKFWDPRCLPAAKNVRARVSWAQDLALANVSTTMARNTMLQIRFLRWRSIFLWGAWELRWLVCYALCGIRFV